MDLDDSVLARLRQRDVGALEQCYRAFGPRVQRLCRKLVGNVEGEDAAQEVFMTVFEHAERFQGRARFSTWLYQVTVNHCLKRLERERCRRTEALSGEYVAAHAEHAVRAVDDRDQVETWLAWLSAEHRAVLLLREMEGLDYQEISAVLGVPVGTVMSRLHRARTSLIEIERAAGRRAPKKGAMTK